jgi:hypothetical protein
MKLFSRHPKAVPFRRIDMCINYISRGPSLNELVKAFQEKSEVRFDMNCSESFNRVFSLKWHEDERRDGVLIIEIGNKYNPPKEYHYIPDRRVGCDDGIHFPG